MHTSTIQRSPSSTLLALLSPALQGAMAEFRGRHPRLDPCEFQEQFAGHLAADDAKVGLWLEHQYWTLKSKALAACFRSSPAGRRTER
jgi:hypothetical protein